MKIAIIHDNFAISGGGEKMMSILSTQLEKSGHYVEIFTYDIAEDTKKLINKNLKIKCLKEDNEKIGSFLKEKIFRKLRLKNFDFYIFSGHSSLSCARWHSPNLFYCNNLPWPAKQETNSSEFIKLNDSSLENFLVVAQKIKNKITKKEIPPLLAFYINSFREFFAFSQKSKKNFIKFLKSLKKESFFDDRQCIENIQKILVNSKNIKNKVRVRYGRDSIVVFPPVETENYYYNGHKNYWISLNRITPKKRIEIQLKAFSKMPDENLLIIGKKELDYYYQNLLKIKPSNVTFLGTVNELNLFQKLSYCKGLIFTAEDEDFGLAPVEAMASGKPVIAPNEGGCKETIINGKTGVLIDDINEDKLAEAIKKLGKEIEKNPLKYKKSCQTQAKNFDTKIFIEKIKQQIG